MRRMVLALLLLLAAAAPAQAVTIRDIIDLTKAGLGDEVLLALIEVDGSMFQIDTETLTRLKAAGVSERVIVALVRSGRTAAASPQAPAEPILDQAVAPAPPPRTIYVEQPPTTVVREVEVPVPYYVTVPVVTSPAHRRGRHVDDDGAREQEKEPANKTDRPADRPTVYWGSGGKLRPDAWKPRD